MRFLRRQIPSMFHRRLSLLLLVFGALMAGLWVQLFRLTVVQGASLRTQAERRLVEREPLPTVRGNILDRKGRILVTDKPVFEVRVDYRVITGQWAYDQALSVARQDFRSTGQSWAELPFDAREKLIAQYRPTYDERLERLWQTLAQVGEVDRLDIERRKTDIIARVQGLRAHVWGQWRDDRQERLGRPVGLEEVAETLSEELAAHTIVPALEEDKAHELLARMQASPWPGVRVERSKVRQTLHEVMSVELDRSTLPAPVRPPAGEPQTQWIEVRGVAANLVGTMRDAWKEDVQRRPYFLADGGVDRGGYREGDRVGSSGIEAAEEDRLRGLRGLMTTRRDTGEVTREVSVPGRDVHLTVDVQLQARVMALMDPAFGLMRVQPWHGNDTPEGTDLHGAAIVLDVDSGEILAMVSTPSAPPRLEGQPYPDLRLDPNLPLVNKPLEAIYEPGSTIKPIIYAIAASQRAVEWNQHVHCRGYYLDGFQDRMRCWIYRPQYGNEMHYELDPIQGIARSCNIYFYTCADRLGPARLLKGLRDWGFAQPAVPGVGSQVNGLLPDDQDPAQVRRLDREHVDAMIGIGQGEIAVPPIQIAGAHAALARGGYYLSPLLVRERVEEQVDRELHIPPQVIRNALKGMYESSNNMDFGTGAYIRYDRGGPKEPIITFDGATVRAKTGTATTPPQYPLVLRVDEKGRERIVEDKGRPPLRDGTHSWYVAHVQKPGRERASYIVVVMVEYGGSGGRVAGPLTNQVLYALRAEGYL
jgi:penicillin-binding protein 2